jgi:hypothetical protein
MNLININAAEGNNSRVKVRNSNDDIRRQPPHCDSDLQQDERIASGKQDSKLPKTPKPVSGHQFLRSQLQNVGSSLQRLKCSRLLIGVAIRTFQRRRERRFDGRQLTVSLAMLLWAALPMSAAIGRWTQSSRRKDDISFYTSNGISVHFSFICKVPPLESLTLNNFLTEKVPHSNNKLL